MSKSKEKKKELEELRKERSGIERKEIREKCERSGVERRTPNKKKEGEKESDH